MFVVETGQMSAVESGKMTAAETSVLSQQCPWLLLVAGCSGAVWRLRSICGGWTGCGPSRSIWLGQFCQWGRTPPHRKPVLDTPWGGQEEGNRPPQRYHTPDDPKGSADRSEGPGISDDEISALHSLSVGLNRILCKTKASR